ncbi:MAG: hypothetical protein E7013_00550 [Alphaproteobacteria bacterium]|nr:hypothetical protein [Alphaproteobacteria bacterium]
MKKCFILNAIVLMAVAPAMAADYGVDVTETKTYTETSFDGTVAGIYSGTGKTGTFTAEDIVIKDTERGIYAVGTDSKVIIGSESEFTDSLTISNVSNRGIRAEKGAEVDIYTDDVSISAGDDVYALHVRGTTSTNQKDESDIVTLISINAEDVNLTSKNVAAVIVNNASIKQDKNNSPTSKISIVADNINISSDSIALSTMSEGIIELTGNTVLNAPDVISARGESTININTTDATKTLKMDGNINFSYNNATSKSGIDANVNVALNGTESYWSGNTTVNWDVKPENEKLIVSNATVSLNEGATWNVAKIEETDTLRQNALNNLIVNKGTISVGTGAKAWVENMQVNGNLTLNGSVTADSVVFANNSSLTTTLLKDTAIITANTVEVGENSI